MKLISYLKKILLFLVLIFVFLQPLRSEEFSLKRCLLLPILDEIDGAIGHKVFEEIETYLQSSQWCYYRSNSEIINILHNYKNNLKNHLENPQILKLIANKSKAGSLIKINLVNQIKGIEVQIKVIDGNGEDLFYSEKEFVETQDINKVIQEVRIHLQRYSKTIPYHARVLGVLGKQLTLDIGSLADVKIGHKFFIKRKINKIEHPLLKSIVVFETEDIAKGEIVSVTEGQSVAMINSDEVVKKVKVNDWIIFSVEKSQNDFDKEIKYPEVKGHEFGKLGTIGVGVVVGSGENATYTNGVNRSIGGMLVGLEGHVEAWATRNYWLKFEMEKDFASYKKELGPVTRESNEVNTSVYKVTTGYRYLPLDFFYGPQVDGYIGYGKYSYDVDTINSDGLGSSSFYGILIGSMGSMPVYHQIRTYLRADLIFKPSYYEDIKIHGEKTASHSYHFEVGGLYDYDPRMQIRTAISRTSNQAKFNGPDGEVRYKETRIKLGVIFTF